MSYLKPQTPIELGGNYIYPLTTADQVIVGNGNRLNSLFKKTIQETVILKASNWSESVPYTQTITLTESVDDYKVDANVMYNGNENDSALNKAAGCLSYIEKNRKEITFYCLKNKPEIDIPVEITGTCRNTIATVEDRSKLNYSIEIYETEDELLTAVPTENTIGVVTTTPINGYCFSTVQPEHMQPGEVWFSTGAYGPITLNIIKENTIMVYLLGLKQMVNDSLINVVAKIYQDGKWCELSAPYIHDNTRGYNEEIFGSYSTPSIGGELIKVSENGIVASISKSCAGLVIDNAIDLTPYSSLEFDITITNLGVNSGTGIGFASHSHGTDNTSVHHPSWDGPKWVGTSSGTTHGSIDLSTTNTRLYFRICAWNAKFTVSNIRFTYK